MTRGGSTAELDRVLNPPASRYRIAYAAAAMSKFGAMIMGPAGAGKVSRQPDPAAKTMLSRNTVALQGKPC